ncbi:hypothetical protein EC968_003521 [Mortierella alpina]|nr:hypothetical protein EC968_003521 [Mortierella alpina]
MITVAVILLSISSITFVAAQTPIPGTSRAQAPIPATSAAYVTIDEKVLYVQGGFTNLTAGVSLLTDQFFTLNLTHNWTSSSPPWKAVTGFNGRTPPLNWGNSLAVLKSKESLIMWASEGYGAMESGLLSFSIGAKSWTAIAEPLPAAHTNWYKLKSVVDPATGLVYIPSGWNNGTGMAIYNPETNNFTSVPMPSIEIMTPTVGYSTAVWSTLRDSILIYGGLNFLDVRVGNPFLVEYSPRSGSWSRLKTTGDSPGDISSHCMVSAYNGTKMVVFGGNTIAREPQAGIFILDVKTLVWTQGNASDQSQRRSDMTCTVAGDNFVVWGGEFVASKIDLFGTPLIYNLKTNQWTTDFILSDTTLPIESPPSPPSKDLNIGAIAGSCTAVIVVILAAFLIYRRGKYRQLARQSSDLSLVTSESETSTKPRGSSNLVALYSPSAIVGSPHALTPTYGSPHTPTATTGYQYSFSVTSSSPHAPSPSPSPSPSPGSGSFPLTLSRYVSSPPSSDAGSVISPRGPDFGGGNGHKGYGKAEYSDSALPMQSSVRGSPQACVPGVHYDDTLDDVAEQGSVGARKQNPQYHPTLFQPWGLSQTNRPEYRDAVSTSSDVGLEQQLELLRAQQEQRYQLQQQNLERVMLEHQRQLQQLHEQLRTKS